MYVFHTNQIGCTINSQSNFLVSDVAVKCNKIILFFSFQWKLDTCFSRTGGCN